MAKSFSYAFYHSQAWADARERALVRDAHLCQHCLEAGRVEPAVMVHHIVELTPANVNDPNFSTNTSNLVSLCDRCHKKVHGWIPTATRDGLAFDDEGNLVSLNH